MIRRNLILAILAVPAAAGSAAIFRAIDLPEVSTAPSQSEVQSISGKPIAQATVKSSHQSSPTLGTVQAGINEPSVLASASKTPEFESGRTEPANAAEGHVCTISSAWTYEAVSSSAPDANDIIQHGDRRQAKSAGQISVNTVAGTSLQSMAQVGGGAAPSSVAALAVAIPVPSQSSTGASRMAAMSMDGEFCWWFEPLPLSITFGEAAAGQPVPLALQIINAESQPEVFACQVSVFAIGDDGETLGEVRPAAEILVSVDGETTGTHDLAPLQFDELLPWLKQTQTINVVATGVGQSSGDQLASDNYLYVQVPSISVTFTPDMNVQAGDLVKVTVESYEPLGFALSNAKLRFNGGTQLMQTGQTAFEDGTASDIVVLLGDLPAQSDFVREEWFVAIDPTWAWMSVQLEAEEILPQYNGAALWDDSDWIDPGDGDDVYLNVSLSPDTDVQAGDLVKVTIQSDGPLAIALTDVILRLNGGTQLMQDGQSVSDDGTVSDVVIALGDLPAQSDLLHEEWFVALDPAWAGMSVQLEAQEIDPQYGWAQLCDDTYWSDPDFGTDVRLGVPQPAP